MAGLVTKLRELGTDVTDEALADVATVSAGNNRVVRRCGCHRECEVFGMPFIARIWRPDSESGMSMGKSSHQVTNRAARTLALFEDTSMCRMCSYFEFQPWRTCAGGSVMSMSCILSLLVCRALVCTGCES